MTLALFCLVLLNTYLRPTSSQQCRLVPVCDENANLGGVGALKGEKGDQGNPGKAGPSGLSIKGVKGDKGDLCDIDGFQEEIRQKLSNLETSLKPASCLTSSVYGLQTLRSGENVFCDAGWTVFQRRYDGSVSFDRVWQEYKSGFGSIEGEFWLGLDKVHQLTRLRGCRLRFDLWDHDDDQAFAEYSVFAVEDESDNYRLHIAGYSGTAGNGMLHTNDHHNKIPFTTKDRDNDEHGGNCATLPNRQGGWWYKNCFFASLNAPWGRSVGSWTRIVWYQWKGENVALKATQMKLRCD